jgi:acetylornithine deacetylase/succinyl-diaminopimelate desuccinylase-like protein
MDWLRQLKKCKNYSRLCKDICIFFLFLNFRGFKLFPFITPASSDANYLRAKGVSAFGFCPISEIPVRAHQHDEFLPGDMYLKGIEVYKKIIENIGNC